MFEVVKVVIRGEMPNGCGLCPLSHSIGGRRGVCRALSFTGDFPQIYDSRIYAIDRPNWCPLVLESEGEEEPMSGKEWELRNANPYDLNDVNKMDTKK